MCVCVCACVCVCVRVCVCVCVCVCVTTLAAVSLISTLELNYEQLYHFNSWISFRSYGVVCYSADSNYRGDVTIALRNAGVQYR